MKFTLFDFISGNYLIVKNGWIKEVWKKRKQEYVELTGKYHSDNKVRGSKYNPIYSETILWENGGWELTLEKHVNKITGSVRMNLNIKGCPSSIHYGGNNYDSINYHECVKIIKKLCFDFKLDFNQIKLAGAFEPSITVYPDFYISKEDLENLMIFKNTNNVVPTFNSDGKFRGYDATYSHYVIKIYLTAVKFKDKSLNAIRIEKHYNRIGTFIRKTKIEYWAQLFSAEGMVKCGDMLLEMWADIFIIDRTLRISKKCCEPMLNTMIKEGKLKYYFLSTFLKWATDKTRDKYLLKYNARAYSNGLGFHKKIEDLIKKEVDKFRNVTYMCCNISESTVEEVSITSIDNNNKQDKTILPMKQEQVSTPVIKSLSKKEKAVNDRILAKQLEFNFMKALNATMKSINDNTVAINKLTKYLQTKAA